MNLFSALRKSSHPSSHLVLHISEGMDIKRAIELKKKEAERLQNNYRKDPCLVTLRLALIFYIKEFRNLKKVHYKNLN